MSKEVIIVFVYDKEKCQDEADDPISAVSYFHPTWVSDTQKLTLCGQLMGVSRFLELNFHQPSIISLENGKFVIKDFGRFLLAFGTDRNVSDSILEHKAKLLTSLIRLFHRDIENIYEQCMQISGQYRNFCTKLYYILETYISTIQYTGNIFQNVSILKLPTSGSNIFLDAIQTLQCCQQSKGVLGGAILYHNKVVATQLSPSLSKRIISTDPYRIKSTAEGITVGFHVPVGVQLIKLYISSIEYMRLRQEATRAQKSLAQIGNLTTFSAQIKRKIKRDKSIIFSHIPEEEVLPSSGNVNVEEVLPKPIKSRPTHLPLRFKNVSSKEIPESGINSITFSDTDSFPQFIGKTSVCSTPIAENKVLVGSIMPICANRSMMGMQKNVEEDARFKQKTTEIKLLNFLKRPEMEFKKFKRRFSMRTLQQTLTPIYVQFMGNDAKDSCKKQRSLTITDPNYPVFNDDGYPISKYLYDSYVSNEDDAKKDEELADVTVESLKIDGFEYEAVIKEGTPKRQRSNLEEENELKSNINNSKRIPGDIVEKRKGLSLPLKSLSMDSKVPNTNTTNSNSEALMRHKAKLSGIPLTPLMSKLSILAADDERSSGFSSWDTTPGYADTSILTPIDLNKMALRRKSSVSKIDDTEGNEESELNCQKVDLFLCGHQNMTMILLLEEDSVQKKDIIQAMWEICIARLTKIENSLHKIFNINVDGLADKSDGNYSFICFDPKWDILHSGGLWTTEELLLLEEMHNDLKINSSFTETIIRCEDSILYGYQCGDMNIFYKQPVLAHKGLPPPADAMGNISLIAKKRLERDHSVILL
ncbi:uncharacterized protein LOC129796776 [Lutzomyia longipalpis]|uniref:uncharacterized protein LOC129796776 n=1 Tax=Lutzomyia longipalpis TaxID=7200 RepID=UPI0024838CAD|nr:uncharacterized protein LOC129796776 [Lutzomyia longipalpis]